MLRIGTFWFLSLIATIIAFSIMHRNYVATTWTSVSLALALEEFIDAFFTDDFLVFNHAHAVTCFVQLVNFS